MPTRRGPATSSLLVAAGLALLLAACSTPPPPPPAPVGDPASGRPAVGEVLGRSDRLLVYLPAPGDSLRSVAARFLGAEDLDWQIAEFNGVARLEPGQPLVVPLKPHNPIGVQADYYQTVPILCYHRFGAAGSNGWSGKMSVTTANFAAQLDWLARNDYRVIRLSQLLAYLEGRQPLPRRSVVITIDDGYESVYRHAFPLLRKHGMPATLFIYTDFIGAGDALDWAQLQEMSASGLIDVQSHSRSHRNLIERVSGESDERYRQALEAETRGPRELIEKRLKAPVRHYAYPYGDANEVVLDMLAREKYQLGLTVNPGGNAFFAQPLMLRRTMIYGDHDLDEFRARLQTRRAIGAP